MADLAAVAPKIDEHAELIMRNQSEGGDALLQAERDRRRQGEREMGGILFL